MGSEKPVTYRILGWPSASGEVPRVRLLCPDERSQEATIK
jgi:hypothetical protein